MCLQFLQLSQIIIYFNIEKDKFIKEEFFLQSLYVSLGFSKGYDNDQFFLNYRQLRLSRITTLTFNFSFTENTERFKLLFVY